MSQSQYAVTPNAFSASNFRISFTINGEPRALQRHKYGTGRHAKGCSNKFKRSHYLRPYFPSRRHQDAFKKEMITAIGNQSVPAHFRNCILDVEATFLFARPMEHFESNGDLKEKHFHPIITCKKADVDNLLKFVLDCLQGTVVQDDFRFQKMTGEKQWSPLRRLDTSGRWMGVGRTVINIKAVHFPRTKVAALALPDSAATADGDWSTDDDSTSDSKPKAASPHEMIDLTDL